MVMEQTGMIRSYKIQVTVVSHHHLLSEKTWLIKEESHYDKKIKKKPKK